MGWYITILQEMRDTLGLKGNELLVYAVIYGYSQEGQGCFYGSLSHLCDICGIASRQTAISTIKSLMDKGLINKTETTHNGVKYVSYTASKNWTGSPKIGQGDSPKNGLNNKEDIYINNTLSIKAAPKFKKPSVEEVREYCLERGNSVDAQAFVDFYESKGWKVGNAAMKDWRACVRTWESREKHSSPRPSSRNTTNKSSNFQVMRDMLERNRATMQGGQVDEQ